MADLVAVHRISNRQHGLVTAPQLRSLGWHPSAIRRAIQRRLFVPIRPSVYVLAGALPTFEQAVLAACLAGGDGTVASHGTAARVWGLDLPDEAGIHLTSPPGRRIRLDGVVAHRSSLLPHMDVTRHRRIPVTSGARTVVDVSPVLGPVRTGRLLDQAERRGHTNVILIRCCVARLAGPGRRRLGVIRQVLARRLPGYDPGDSELEVRALRALHDAGLPAPVQQHRVKLAGRRRYLDLAYADARIAIEVEGWDSHRTRSAFDDDRARRNELEAEGWHVVQFTSAMTDTQLVDVVTRLLRRSAGPTG